MIENIVDIILFILCVCFSAFFSSAEVALVSITKAKVRIMVNEKRHGSGALVKLKEHPERLLITLLIGNNIVNISAAAIATAVAIRIFGDIGVGIATGIVVIILLVFGEIGPKIYVARGSEQYALEVAPVILFLSRVFWPVIWLFDRAGFGPRHRADLGEPAVTEEEIKEWIDVGKEEGTIEQGEQEMIYSVLEFGDTTAREVMTPRIDVILIEDSKAVDEAIRLFNETGLSRIPVYHEKIDNIVGILNFKDIFSVAISKPASASIREIMYDPFFVPETIKIDDLLKELQVRQTHLAVVIDEYSSFVGIVTVEDIFEELVGDIRDEYDGEEPEIQKTGEGVFLVDARIWVEDVNEKLGLALPVDESYETVGGLLIDRLGHIPQHPGEKTDVMDGRVTLVVMQMHGRRIVKVKVVIHPEPAGEGQ